MQKQKDYLKSEWDLFSDVTLELFSFFVISAVFIGIALGLQQGIQQNLFFLIGVFFLVFPFFYGYWRTESFYSQKDLEKKIEIISNKKEIVDDKLNETNYLIDVSILPNEQKRALGRDMFQ